MWLSVDPLAHKTDEQYQFLKNNPISFVDPNGKQATEPPGENEILTDNLTEPPSDEVIQSNNGSKIIGYPGVENSLPELDQTAPWMGKAKSQLGVKEDTNNNDGKEVEGYLRTTGLGKGNAWCGAFVNWCLEEVGIDGVEPTKDNHPARALSWRNFGERVDEPFYGAIATKTRKGGGHVGFVVGVSPEGQVLILGGNQGDAVTIRAYDHSVLKFNYPTGYTKRKAPVIAPNSIDNSKNES